MNKKSFAFILFIGILGLASAQNVNENELRSAGDANTIVFENYEGPHAVIETVSAINSIGTGLGSQLKRAGTEKSGSYGTNEKYSVIHAVDSSEQGKLDADIIFINENATVDHIRNLRRIIASYLTAAYDYNEKDATTIATFVTVYNAVYRNKLDVFNTKYKNVVLQYLSEENCGLSIKWNEWAGKSQIIIPLGEYSEGGLSSVDTSIISDKNVVQSMKEEDDKGVDERKNMVDIKEREAENAEQKAQDSAKQAAEDKKALEEQKQVQKAAEQNAQKKQAEAENAKAEAQKAQEESDKDPENVEKKQEAQKAQEEAQKAEQEAEEAQEEAQKEQAKTEEQQQKTDESTKAAEEQQQKADKKQTEAQEERSEIAKDQKEILENELKQAEDGTVIGLKVVNENDYLSTLVKVNSKTGQLIKESPVKVIRGRTIIPVQDAIQDVATGATFAKATGGSTFYMAICGEDKGNASIKLCLLDAFKMEIQKESEEVVSKHSVLVNSGSNFYCVIKDNSSWCIGRFDKSINLLQKSQLSVTESTPITITSNGLVVTNSKGVPTLISASDLTEISE